MTEYSIENIEMVGDNILIDFDMSEMSSATSSEDIPEHRNVIGDILSVGDKVVNFKVGDKVLVPSGVSMMIQFNGITYHVFKEMSLFAKIK